MSNSQTQNQPVPNRTIWSLSFSPIFTRLTINLLASSLSILLLSGSVMADQVYRWTDEYGNVHFSEKPPKNQQKKYDTLDVKAQEKNGTVFASDELIEQMKSDNNDANKNSDQKTKEKQKQKSNQSRYCEKKRRKLAEIETYMKIHKTLLDEQKAKALRELIKQEC